jgi:hypothetical protein
LALSSVASLASDPPTHLPRLGVSDFFGGIPLCCCYLYFAATDWAAT